MDTPTSHKQLSTSRSKSDVEWVGESYIEWGNIHYKKCIIRGIPVNVDDFVTINTGNILSVGRVLDLHDLGPFKDPYRVEILWLYNLDDMRQLMPNCPFDKRDNELFIPAYDPNRKIFHRVVQVMNAEAIDDICNVKMLKVGQKFPSSSDAYYVMYAFDENFDLYSAVDYNLRLDKALLDRIEYGNKKKKVHRRVSTSSGQQWRIGTPDLRNQNCSPFSLKPLKITLKACQPRNLYPKERSKQNYDAASSYSDNSKIINKPAKKETSKMVTYINDSDIDIVKCDSTKYTATNTPCSANSDKRKVFSKRKASKSIPDEGEIENKKTKMKENRPLNSVKIEKKIKKGQSPGNNSFNADQVRDLLSDEYSDVDSDEDTGESDSDEEKSGITEDSGNEVFITVKVPAIAMGRSKSTTKNKKTLKNKPAAETRNKPSTQTQNTKTPRAQSTRKQSAKTPKRKPTTVDVCDDILGGEVTPRHSPAKKWSSSKSLVQGMTPSMPSRSKPCKTPRTPLQEARSRLHVSSVPTSLPCRENEFADIFGFVEGKLMDGTGGCMYISGVPGTGKTATVHEVIRVLKESEESEDVPSFRFIEINGMKLTEPNQAYSMLLKKLTGQRATPPHASDILEKMFNAKSKSKESLVVMVDELDLLWTRKQGVMYNLFEWPSHTHSKLIVLAIANTMDLPERMMINKVQSRLGLTRLTFQPYTFVQLQEIVFSRIQSLNVFNPDALQLVARKVAAISGDARRCLDICRRAVELAEQQDKKTKSKIKKMVDMAEVNIALQDMFSSPKIKFMMNLSSYEMLLMKAILSEFKRTGIEETTFGNVYDEFCNHCRLEGSEILSMAEVSSTLGRLGTARLLLVETGRLDLQRKISMNVNQDDVIYAFRNHSVKKS